MLRLSNVGPTQAQSSPIVAKGYFRGGERVKERYCDCLICPCNVSLKESWGSRVCPECAPRSNHMSWKTGKRYIPELGNND